MPEKERRAVIAGGGTGGHIYAGLSIAEEMKKRWGDGTKILYVGAAGGLEAKILPSSGIEFKLIESMGIKGKKISSMLKGIMAIPQSLVQSSRILNSFKPHIAVGVGGYSSGPVILSAWLRGVPSLILEQNLYPGATNRILSVFAKKIAVNFRGSMEAFPAKKVFWSGNPVRDSVRKGSKEKAIKQWGLEEGKFTLLVFGGSQGARRINELVPEAAVLLKKRGCSFQLIHQTGERDFEKVREKYKNEGIAGFTAPFILNMEDAYAAADMVVSRAGATTLSELQACRKASILIPFPYATNNHQEHNARSMEKEGAALMMRESEITGESLADAIENFISNRGKLELLSGKAGQLSKINAAEEIVKQCEMLF